VTKAVDPGLQKTLEEEIVPRLLAEIPGQASPEELATDPLRHRFTLVFDREGYSPDLFSRLKDLPPEQRVAQLRGGRKHFIDTIKLIAYRAETALVQLVRETLRRHDDARSFVRGLFASSVNLRPDPAHGELRIEIHGQANPIHDTTLEAICRELNDAEILYPGTHLRLVYRPIRSSSFPSQFACIADVIPHGDRAIPEVRTLGVELRATRTVVVDVPPLARRIPDKHT
jgi:hypothetical protein